MTTTDHSSAAGPEPRPQCSRSECLCGGAGPAVSGAACEFARRFGPSSEVRKHFETARVEILKGLRAFIDQRIQDAQKPDNASRGSKVTVE